MFLLNRFNTYLIVLLQYLLCLVYSPVHSKITHSIGGNWSVSGSWTNGVPACGDTIIIDSGETITVDINVNLDENSSCSVKEHLKVAGTLVFGGGKKMHLACNSYVEITASGSLQKAGGGGSSNLISICNVTVWHSGDGTLTGPSSLGSGSPLPIELIDFGVRRNHDIIELYWTTATETNNDHFEAERSTDARNFKVIAFVQGAGTSRQYSHYSSQDLSPEEGYNYYRLKQVDFDGAYSYSHIVAEHYRSGKEDMRIVPNPNNGEFSILSMSEGIHEILIYDQKGSFLMKIDLDPRSFTQVKLPRDVVKGNYVIQFISRDEVTGRSFTVE